MKELTIPLQSDSGIPLYEQIYEYIRHEIIDGKISPGEKLPSTRLLAGYLQVSRSTIDLAYDQLVSEGYVQTVPGSGYYVCDIKTDFFEFHREKANRVARPGSHGTGGCKEHESKDVAANSRGHEYFCDFSPYDVEWPQSSMNAWRKATKAMLQEEMEELFLPGDSQGEQNLRQVISDYLHRARGVVCQKEQIIAVSYTHLTLPTT